MRPYAGLDLSMATTEIRVVADKGKKIAASTVESVAIARALREAGPIERAVRETGPMAAAIWLGLRSS